MQIPEELVQYITTEIIKRLNLPPAKPPLRLVGSRNDLSPCAVAALEEHFEITEQPDWKHSVPVGAAVLFTPAHLARSAKRGGLKMTSECCCAAPAPPPRSAPAIAGKRPLITEGDLVKLCPPSAGEGQELRLPQGAIITPLARDYIRAMKITLI